MFTSLVRRLGGKRTSKPSRMRAPKRVSLGLECLEARELPSVSPLTMNSNDNHVAGLYGSAAPTAGITPGAIPAAPTLSATAVSASQIDLAWNKVTGATSYKVDELINGAWKQVATEGSTVVSDPIAGLHAGTAYSFKVGATNSSGTHWSVAKSATTHSAAVAPNAPTFTLTPASTTQINVSWNSVSGATSYAVAEWINGAWTTIASLGSGSTSYAVTGLSPGSTYSFEVGAANSAGTDWAGSQNATTLSAAVAPNAPTFTLTPVSSAQININWNQVSGATSYAVGEWINGTWTTIASLGSGSTSYSVTGLSQGVTYYFEVAAANSVGTTWAAWQSAVTLAPPVAPTFTFSNVTPVEVDLAWSSVSGATGYAVGEWSNGSWVTIATLGSGGTGYAVTGLNGDTTYYFEVAASNSLGTTWANWQSIATTGLAIPGNAPAASVAYSPASGTLFGSGGPVYTDVQQGQVGDCWLMSSLAEVAARAPQDIVNMFTYDGVTGENGAIVGVYTVRFFDNGSPVYITVDTQLPGGGSYYDQTNGVLWVALAEKAYAEANGYGYVTTGSPGTNSYAALNGGWPSWALPAIAGVSAAEYSANPNDITTAWNAGEFVVLCTTSPTSSLIVGEHCYALVADNASSSQPYELYNPWGLSTSAANGVYGLFTCNAPFISQNFTQESFGWSAAPTDTGGQTKGIVNAQTSPTEPAAPTALSGPAINWTLASTNGGQGVTIDGEASNGLQWQA